MPRSLMNATVEFGDVVVPVQLHTAQTSEGIHFHEVHLKDGARIEHRRFCSKEDKEVPYEEIAKGHEVADGTYAVLTKEQLEMATPGGDKAIRIEEFVPAADIDPILHDRAYHLGAGEGGAAAYRLLHDALAKTGRAGVAFFVFHKRERLAAVVAHDGVLVLQTLRAADAIVPLDDLRAEAGDDDVRAPTAKERRMAEQLIDALHETFDAGDYADEHRAAVMKVVKAKAAGDRIDIPEPEEDVTPDDLAAALQASLDAREEHGGRRRRGGGAKKKKPARRPGSRPASGSKKKKGS